MSKRLEEILSEFEEENECHFHDLDKRDVIFPAMIQYAREVAQASLERASKVAKTFRNGNSGSYLDASIDKKSITQESNIVML